LGFPCRYLQTFYEYYNTHYTDCFSHTCCFLPACMRQSQRSSFIDYDLCQLSTGLEWNIKGEKNGYGSHRKAPFRLIRNSSLDRLAGNLSIAPNLTTLKHTLGRHCYFPPLLEFLQTRKGVRGSARWRSMCNLRSVRSPSVCSSFEKFLVITCTRQVFVVPEVNFARSKCALILRITCSKKEHRYSVLSISCSSTLRD